MLKSKKKDLDVRIVDFGLATYITLKKNQMLFTRCGTPGFVAPEIINYEKSFPIYNEKCDIFSAGVIFYIL